MVRIKLFSTSYTLIFLMVIYSLLFIVSMLTRMDLYNITIMGCQDKKTDTLNKSSNITLMEVTTLPQESQSKPTKVLILAYPRTGSSLLGEIVSAPEDTTYFFEPLHTRKMRANLLPLRQTAPVKDVFTDYVSGLFNCDPAAMKYFYQVSFIKRCFMLH